MKLLIINISSLKERKHQNIGPKRIPNKRFEAITCFANLGALN
jgi:hypothetical protein